MHYYLKLTLRLTIAILLAIFYQIFYIIFSPLTFYLSYLSIKLFQPTALLEANKILINNNSLSFIPACVAASAYLLLALLILLTKDIPPKKAILLFILGSLLILAANLIRINLLILIFISYGHDLFQVLHLFFWKILSTLYVALVWIFLIIKFNIKSIPIYSDYKKLVKKIKNTR